MRTKKNIQKIEVLKPTSALLRSKKGFGPLILILAALGFGVIGFGAYQHFFAGDKEPVPPEPLAVTEVTVPTGETKAIVVSEEKQALLSCSGTASVKALYNDINYFKIGTDPNDTLTIYEKIGDENFALKAVADDATSTSVTVLSSFKALAGNNAGTPISSYFAEEVEFTTICSDIDIQPRLYPASAPTITVVNEDGVTKNSDSNHEAMDANTPYNPCITIKAPAEACSARYGAIVVFEYDATYVNSVSSSDLKSTDASFLVAHTTNHSGTGLDMDQYKIMKWTGAVMDINGDGVLDAGALCDSKKVEICYAAKTTASTPGEDQANVQIHWYPINKDLDADDFVIITGIYDEDNNVIAQGNTTATYYGA